MFLLIISIAIADAPTHTNPLLQETTGGSETNLTGINQTGASTNGKPIILNYNWYHKDILNGSRWINDTNLIGYWAFDQSNYSDFSGRKNPTNIGTASPTFVSGGQIEWAYDFEKSSTQNFNLESNLNS